MVVTTIVKHDLHLQAALRPDAAPAPLTWRPRLRRWLGIAHRDPAPVAPAIPPADDAWPALEALAALVTELLDTAQTRVEGAALLVERSVDETRAYAQALAIDMEALREADCGADVTGALIDVTRVMIARARGAEERLRSMSQEFGKLQTDLAEARTSAERDQLTGLPNRRALEGALASAILNTRQANVALSLAFCDIDHFKRLNDAHGHALGDRVLRLVGDCLSDGAGQEAFVGRQGGEEFLMLFEGKGADEAATIVDAIRAELAAREFKSRTNDVAVGSVTFSAGVAQLAPGEDADGLLQRADEALYRAKGEGRNRVVIDRTAGPA